MSASTSTKLTRKVCKMVVLQGDNDRNVFPYSNRLTLEYRRPICLNVKEAFFSITVFTPEKKLEF